MVGENGFQFEDLFEDQMQDFLWDNKKHEIENEINFLHKLRLIFKSVLALN